MGGVRESGGERGEMGKPRAGWWEIVLGFRKLGETWGKLRSHATSPRHPGMAWVGTLEPTIR